MPHKHLFRRVFVLLFLVCVIPVVSLPTAAHSPSDAEGTGQSSQGSDPAQVNPANGPDQITAVPNRPTFSTTAESVQSGVFEIEYGFEASDGHQNINGLLKFGLTKNLELRFLVELGNGARTLCGAAARIRRRWLALGDRHGSPRKVRVARNPIA